MSLQSRMLLLSVPLLYTDEFRDVGSIFVGGAGGEEMGIWTKCNILHSTISLEESTICLKHLILKSIFYTAVFWWWGFCPPSAYPAGGALCLLSVSGYCRARLYYILVSVMFCAQWCCIGSLSV